MLIVFYPLHLTEEIAHSPRAMTVVLASVETGAPFPATDLCEEVREGQAAKPPGRQDCLDFLGQITGQPRKFGPITGNQETGGAVDRLAPPRGFSTQHQNKKNMIRPSVL